MEASSLPRPARRLALRPSRRLLAPLSDERLVEHVRRGNDAAFEVIYDRHHRGVLAFARHMLRSADEAEDAVQHTFIAAYADLSASSKPIRLKPWLYTIARNRCLSVLRARRERALPLPEIPTAGLSDAVLRRDDLRRLLADVQTLPEDQRAALVLSELGDLSHAEVAEIVGCETVKVKALVFQARSSLIESRRASEVSCVEIREQLATARGGALRRGLLRRHLRSCPGCSEYRESVARQRTMLALVLPVVPSAGLKQGVLAAVGVAPGAAGGAAAGGVAAGGAATSTGAASVGGGSAACGVTGVTGTGVLSSLGAAGAAKVAIVAVVATTGGVMVDRATHAGPAGGDRSATAGERKAENGGVDVLPGKSVPRPDHPGRAGADTPGDAKAQAAKARKHGASAGANGRAAHGGGSSGQAAPGRGNSGHAHEKGAHRAGGGPYGGGGASPSSGSSAYTDAPHGPPATKPAHPSTPAHAGGAGKGSQGKHLGNGQSSG